MHGYLIRLLVQKLYLIHELIREKKWVELQRIVRLECSIEDICVEINDYPSEMTECPIDDFFDAIVFCDFDG